VYPKKSGVITPLLYYLTEVTQTSPFEKGGLRGILKTALAKPFKNNSQRK
jgi:hypothetical protein